MHGAAILRFSDSEGRSTIEEHLRIIHENSGNVWWGWWKKEKESPNMDLLYKLQAEIARRQSISVGLVNRKGMDSSKDTDSLYLANCVEIRHAGDGSRIASPNVDITPEYYRNEKYPAWFRFRQIDKISLSVFKEEFIAVPVIDPTLYEVRWSADGDREKSQVLPGENWNMEQLETSGDTILHISDLHFGSSYEFSLESPEAEQEFGGKPLWEIISTRIKNLRLQIGVVVITGDLITRGEDKWYPHARDFIDRLLQELSLDSRFCIIVPGNHDIWTKKNARLSRQYKHERPYRDFIEAFFHEEFRALERVRRFRTHSGRDIVFIELNSARLRSDRLKEYGYVAKHRYEQLLNYVCRTLQQEERREPPIIFAVLHHHLVPVSSIDIPDDRHPVSLCLDAGELLDQFQHHGVHFVLHGHEHAPFVGRVTPFRLHSDGASNNERPVHIIGCGSSGGKLDVLPRDLVSNIFGLYTLASDHLDVVFEKYTKSSSPVVHCCLSLPIVPWAPAKDLDGSTCEPTPLRRTETEGQPANAADPLVLA